MVRRDFGYVEDYKGSLSPRLDMVEDPIIAGLGYSVSGVGVREKLEQAVTYDYLTLPDIREEDLGWPIETLSHRRQLNVALYEWIIAKARLIVIDNLFSGTDILMRNSVRESPEFAKNRGIDVVCCSLNEGELASACGRLCELAKGEVSCR